LTAAAYSLEHRWDIPVYVWPGVLGVSVAAHLAFLVYGLPVLPWSVEEPQIPPETEVILDAGGPVFDEVSLVAPQVLDVAETVSTELAPEAPLEPVPMLQPEASELQTAINVPIQPELVPTEPLASETVPVLQETQRMEVVEAQNLAPLAVEDVVAAPVETLTVQPIEPEASQAETAPPSSALLVPEQIPADAAQPDYTTIEPVGASEPAILVLTPQEAPLVPELSAEVGDVPVLEVAPVEEIVPLARDSIQPIETPTVQPALQAEQQRLQFDAETQVQTEVTVVEPTTQILATEPPQSPPAVDLTAEMATTVIQSQDTITLTLVEVPEVDSIAPTDLPLTEVEQAETEVAALTPSEPETDSVPAVESPSKPADIVPPVEVATIDPLANITGYVKNYDFGECAHLSVLSAGADSAEVTAFGTGIGAFAVFDQRFKADQGFEASIQLRLVTENQCALLNALGVSGGLEAAGLVELDRTVVRSGALTTGLIHRDLPYARIAAAEQAGLDLSGKGPPELYLIDDAGQIHDGRDFLLPASSSRTAGAWRFEVPVVMMSASDQETALVLAIWNRPPGRQPPRFGTLPPSRVASILAEPGVYSLAAFKVSR